jgi:hypothetical protein
VPSSIVRLRSEDIIGKYGTTENKNAEEAGAEKWMRGREHVGGVHAYRIVTLKRDWSCNVVMRVKEIPGAGARWASQCGIKI